MTDARPGANRQTHQTAQGDRSVAYQTPLRESIGPFKKQNRPPNHNRLSLHPHTQRMTARARALYRRLLRQISSLPE